MKHLVWVILVVMVVLGAVVTGCEGTRRYDSRLMAADSLMRDNPDSALALVQAVCRDSLSGEGDRAYRDLLLTQARYKAYVTATSDSDINRALAWFRAHPSDREKLTRAYIYKGAVMEELGHPDSAMLYYKTAEAIAEEKDYANLGQINLRIAALYRIFFADEETCLDKYRKALRYFELTNNLKQEQICLYNIGVCLSRSDPNECKIHLAKACEIATAIDDSSRIYRCKEFLCRQLASDSASLQEAKLLAFDCLNNFAKFADNNLFFDLASIYAIQDNPDSARYYLRITEENVVNQTAQDKVRYYLTLEVLARNRGDSALCNYYSRLKHHISDSIDNNDNIKRIQQIENQGNLEQYNEKNEVINGLHILVYCLLIAGVLCLSASVTFYLIRRRQARAIIREMNNAHVNNHEQLLLQLDAKDLLIEDFVHKMVSFMQTAIDTSAHDSPSVIQRKLKDSINRSINDDFWNELRNYLDRKHNGIISNIERNPSISKKDLRFIELMCCGFSYVEIAATLNLHPQYISQKRRMIAKKLNLTVDMQDYLNSMMDS